MHERLVSSILLVTLAACGPVVDDGPTQEPLCDPWAEVCEVSLHPSVEARSVLDLETARMTDEPSDEPAETLGDGQVRASIGRYLALQSNLDEPLICVLRDRFERLSDISGDASVCDCSEGARCWDSTALFGLNGSDDVEFEGMGLMLRTSGGELYRGRVLVADSRLEPATLTFEYEGVM